jgi:hypothetical protein
MSVVLLSHIAVLIRVTVPKCSIFRCVEPRNRPKFLQELGVSLHLNAECERGVIANDRAFNLDISASILVRQKKVDSTRHGQTAYGDVWPKDQHSISAAKLVGLTEH